MSSSDLNDDKKKESINTADFQNASGATNESQLSSNESFRSVTDSKANISQPTITPACNPPTTSSKPPASSSLIVAPRVPIAQFTSVHHGLPTHAQNGNNNEFFPTVPFPLAPMRPPPPLPQPLAVDSALLRQRQLAVAAAANVAATQPQTPQQSSYPHLRSGKWLPAEENYALLLVALFERGMIRDCIDGTTTLRMYLSQKLHCAPMRISKKFARRGIGKLIYTSKAPSISDQLKMPELMHRLRIAEQQFLQAAFPSPLAASLGAAPFPLLQVSQTLQQPIPVFPSTMMPGMVPNPIVGVPPSNMATPQEVGSSGPADTHTSELHKSYLRALEQADDEESNVDVPKHSSSEPLPQAIPQPLITTIPPATTEMPDLLSGFEKVVKEMKVVPPTQSHTTSSPPSDTPQEHSPPFTSRSFDEFHRFLGKDEISLLDASPAPAPLDDIPQFIPNSHVTASTMEKESILPVPAIALDTDALFSAESYALLVQANGYDSTMNSFPVTGGHNAYEVENILQQVQTHRIHHEPPLKSESTSSHSSYCDRVHGNYPTIHGHSHTNPPTNVTISNRPSNVGPLSNPPTTTNCVNTRIAGTGMWSRNHHVTATSESEDANIVSGSEPSGGSSTSRSNTSNTSTGTDTAGTTSNEDDGSEEEGLTSSGGEFDSAEDDDNNNNGGGPDGQPQSPTSSSDGAPPPRKRVKGSGSSNKNQHSQRGGHGKLKRVQFQ